MEKSNLTSRSRPSGSASGEREDSDPGDHDVISGADDGQAAEGEERRLTTIEGELAIFKCFSSLCYVLKFWGQLKIGRVNQKISTTCPLGMQV